MTNTLRLTIFLTPLMALFSQTPAAPPVVRTMPDQELRNLKNIPEWKHGWLTAVDPEAGQTPSNPHVKVYAPDGRTALAIRVTAPDIERARIYDVDIVDPSPRIVASGVAWSSQGVPATFLLWADRSGVTRIVRTNPFLAQRLCVAPDGGIWTVGVNSSDIEQNDEIVWRFDASGRLLQKFMPRREFPSKSHPALNADSGRPWIGAVGDRIGVYLAEPQTWLEFTSAGALAGRWVVPLPIANPKLQSSKTLNLPNIVMTADGAVWAWLDRGPTSGLYALDKAKTQWVRISPIPETFAGVYGAEHNKILMRDRAETVEVRYVLFDPAPQK
ncbi:MAG: hypothetical protein IT168_17420 [Bryobacterales bacterium]|nr:hypothetical protein [Bryobacterales bacterium]